MTRHVPEPGTVVLDHLAHFVPDLEAANQALGRLGFTVTPRTPQMNAAADGSLVPAGTENRCVMLEEGYLEFLTPVSETPLTVRMRRALERGTGLHLVCFGEGDPETVRDRLARGGFAPEEPVRLRRTVGRPDGGEGELRFSVCRVPPDAMAEGRIQYVVHHTPDLVWQERWTDHANGARALREVAIVVADPGVRAERYAAFTEGAVSEVEEGAVITLGRGRVALMSPDAWEKRFPASPLPAVPWIAGYGLRVADLELAARTLDEGGGKVDRRGGSALVRLPPVLGGTMLLGEDDPSYLLLVGGR